MTEEPIPLRASRPEDVAAAERALQVRALVVSGNRYQPRIVWTRRPWSREALQLEVEGDGASPFVLMEMTQLISREVLRWPGAPYWAQYAYLIMVEVKAVNVG